MTKLSDEELNQIISSNEGQARPSSDNDLENLAFIVKQDPALRKKVYGKLSENPNIKQAITNEDKTSPIDRVKEKMKQTKFD